MKLKRYCNWSYKMSYKIKEYFTFSQMFTYFVINYSIETKIWWIYQTQIGLIQTRVINWATYNAQKMKFSIKDFLKKCDQISSFIDRNLKALFRWKTKSLKLKRCKFLQPSFTSCEHDCFCFKTLRRFLKIRFFWFLKPF